MVGNFRKHVVIVVVIYFLERAQQKYKYQICQRIAKTVKIYKYNIDILPK